MGASKVPDLRRASFASVVGECTLGSIYVGLSLVSKKGEKKDRGVKGKASSAVCYRELRVT